MNTAVLLATALDAALAAEDATFDVLANAIAAAQTPGLGELLTAYESGARAALVTAACAALEYLEGQA